MLMYRYFDGGNASLFKGLASLQQSTSMSLSSHHIWVADDANIVDTRIARPQTHSGDGPSDVPSSEDEDDVLLEKPPSPGATEANLPRSLQHGAHQRRPAGLWCLTFGLIGPVALAARIGALAAACYTRGQASEPRGTSWIAADRIMSGTFQWSQREGRNRAPEAGDGVPGAIMGLPLVSPAMVPTQPASGPPGGKVGQSPSMAHQPPPPPGARTNPPTPKTQGPSPADILAQQQQQQQQYQPKKQHAFGFGTACMNTVANALNDGPDRDVPPFPRADGGLFERELANWFAVTMDPMTLAEDDGGMK